CNILWASFSQCHGHINPSKFYTACLSDICRCDYTKRDDCHCSIITMYSRYCAIAGGISPNWRTAMRCPRTCDAGHGWTECGVESPQTCIMPNLLVNQPCFDRCHCAPGNACLYEHGSECVHLSQCPCIHRENEYPSGSVQSIYNCNQWLGSGRAEPALCPGTAQVHGYAHYKTFDEKFYTFEGRCQYVFARDNNTDQFAMYTETTECGIDAEVTCFKSFTIILKINGLTQVTCYTVTINRYEVQLPYQNSDLYIFRESSLYISLHHTTTGLAVIWNGYGTVFIFTSTVRAGAMRGLAGNYNGNAADDFISSYGMLESTPASFGNSWKLNKDCPDVLVEIIDACEINSDKGLFAMTACHSIYGSRFSPCHLVVNPFVYYKMCMYEYCECAKELNTLCMCDVLAVYAHKCSLENVYLDWRSESFCLTCKGGQKYHICSSGCGKSCRSLSVPEICTSPCVEGCNCVDGQYLNPSGVCVDDTECPCYHLGSWYHPGQTLHTPGVLCQCIRGRIQCEGTKTLPSVCLDGQIYHNCTEILINNPAGNAQGSECSKTCQNKDLPCPLSLCVSGCACPQDYVWHDDRCILPEDCPCYHNSKDHPSGSSINVDCNTCNCTAGRWTCTDRLCGGECSVIGEDHFHTFDGTWFDFSGDCEYILATDECGTTPGNFKVTFKSTPCDTLGYVCSRTLSLTLGVSWWLQLRVGILYPSNNFIRLLSDETSLAQSNGVDVQYEIIRRGFFQIVTTSIGLTVLWDEATRIYVQVAAFHSRIKLWHLEKVCILLQGKLCGLCGDFDHEQNNDLLMRSQEVVTSTLDFGNNWRLKDSCPPVSTNHTEEKCDAHPDRRSWAIRKCGVIEGPAFAACRKEIDYLKYLAHCLSDTCGCATGGDCECFCTAVAAYAHVCGQRGILVDWRTPDVCPTMCEVYNKNDTCEWKYEECGTSCPDTCCDRGQTNCHLPCVEGCHPQC
uniref:VWFD domain-containing protein n=1 Tax=Ciona savignyi TaxID=51511 RepID=H2YI88_CIOSA